jgi:membrane protease YdiL (CAAX protease family)
MNNESANSNFILLLIIIAKLTSLIFLEGIPFFTGITGKKLIVIMWALVAEEFGWRGFLQEKLDRQFGHIVPSSLWHFTGNLLFNIYLINPEYNQGSIIPYLVFIAYSTIMAICISIWGNNKIQACPKTC